MGVTSLDRVREARRRAQEENEKRNAKYFRFKEGRNIIRIMPPWEDAGDFWKPFGQHFNIGPDGGKVVYCRSYTLGERCFVCDALKKLFRGADEIMKEKLKSMSSNQRYYCNLIDLNDLDKGVQIGELPKTVMEEIWSLMVDDEVGLGDITDPKTGFDLLVDRTGTGLSTKYNVRARRESTKLAKDFIDQIKDLDTFVKIESNLALEAIWSGEELAPVARVTDSRVVDGEFRSLPAPAASVDPPPKDTSCFGSFNDKDERCLDCKEQDDCETAMMRRRREARRKTAEKSSARTPEPTSGPATVSDDELMAEMARAIEG